MAEDKRGKWAQKTWQTTTTSTQKTALKQSVSHFMGERGELHGNKNYENKIHERTLQTIYRVHRYTT